MYELSNIIIRCFKGIQLTCTEIVVRKVDKCSNSCVNIQFSGTAGQMNRIYTFPFCSPGQVKRFQQGTPGFEPGTSRSAVECSTTELYPLYRTYIDKKKQYLNHKILIENRLHIVCFQTSCNSSI